MLRKLPVSRDSSVDVHSITSEILRYIAGVMLIAPAVASFCPQQTSVVACCSSAVLSGPPSEPLAHGRTPEQPSCQTGQ